MKKRPENIKHYAEIQDADDSHYPGSSELHGIGSPFGKKLGLKRIGIHHELLKPGRRTSWPHAESHEEEFVYVIEGNPQVWIDGVVHDLNPGDGVGFPNGTGESHTFLNNSEHEVRLLVVGESRRDINQVYYPFHPHRKAEVKESWWDDVPKRHLGDHDGVPDQLRKKNKS